MKFCSGVAAFVAGALCTATHAAPPGEAAPKLFKSSRESIALARAQGRRSVMLLVAAAPGATTTLVARAQKSGGEVRYRADEVGYLRILMPLEHAGELADAPGIESVAVDASVRERARTPPPEPAPAPPPAPASTPQPWPPQWSDQPLRHPYSSLPEIDAAEFQRLHPTFDGRGVTIALLDSPVDFLLPELQTAYRLDGKPVPKIVDVLNTVDPRDDLESRVWVDMREQSLATGRRMTARDDTYITPRDGTFRIGLHHLRSSAIRKSPGLDVAGPFAVLWDERSDEVWVDTNRNLSFADERGLKQFSERRDIATLGRDDPATPERETVGFVIQIDHRRKAVALNTGDGEHGTQIIGCVVANPDPVGRLRGIAPGARLVSIRVGGDGQYEWIEAAIAAFRHPQVDLVVSSTAAHYRNYPLTDARHPFSVVLRRLTHRYASKLFFQGAGNAPGLALVGEEASPADAVSVGAYQSRESYRVNDGFVPQAAHNLHYLGMAHGPNGSGALKPDLLAPSEEISLLPGFMRGGRVRGLYQLPPGYSVSGGTSTSGPMAAGAAALVISAARQTGVSFDAARLLKALNGSARYLPNLAAHEQGNGLIQVAAAYELLKRLQDVPPVTVVSRAPVRTRLAPLLSTPNEGVGIYEREGWIAGAHGVRSIAFTRTSGSREPMTFNLSWLGNDGTFSSATAVTLPLNRSVEVPVQITAATAGARSAILTLDHPAVPGPVHRALNTIVAAKPFTAHEEYRVETRIALPRPGDHGAFFAVPKDVAALTVAVSSLDREKLRVQGFSPENSYQPRPLSAPTFDVQPHWTATDPMPGVWEVNASFSLGSINEFDPQRPQPMPPAQLGITGTLLGVELTAAFTYTAVAAEAGQTIDIPLKLRNRFAPVTAGAVSGALGSASRTRRSIAQGEQQTYDIVVPRGATSLRARIDEVTDAAADLDIYLFDCTSTPCRIAAQAASTEPDAAVEIAEPAAGSWKVVVDGYRVPTGRTDYAYVDIFAHPALGSLSVTDMPEQRATGATWETTAHVWVASLPETPRQLVARIVAVGPQVKANDGSLVALGSLDIELS
ncbi:MAG TPA: S8 family serine peptidase [Steroidobacteraceae bacterium]|nr:S8 family serine peptidase [Steroidobacteraceae bacterium]